MINALTESNYKLQTENITKKKKDQVRKVRGKSIQTKKFLCTF